MALRKKYSALTIFRESVFKLNSTANRLFKVLTIILLVSACNSTGTPPCNAIDDPCQLYSEIWWDVPIPDFSENEDRPVITLLGSRTQILAVGDDYLEEGAIALDGQDGDISQQLGIFSDVNTSTVGDYIVRYSVTDSTGLVAIEQNRIVRVIGDFAENLSRRPLGRTISNFGYLEHLPIDYGLTLNQSSPLLIYLHGSGANVQFSNTRNATLALDAIIYNYGPPYLIENDEWDDALPFVVLAPHLGAVPSAGYMERLDAFIEYATRAYEIDASRIYLTGWSNGGFISYDYAVNFPNKIAAVVPMSSGLPYQLNALPSNFCNIEQVPVWLFHGTEDRVIPFSNTVQGYDAILNNCQSTILPKLSLELDGEHAIHHDIFNLSSLVGGSANAEYDTVFDAYDLSIYQWLLTHSLEDR